MRYQPTVGSDEEFYRLARVMALPQPFLLLATSYKSPDKPQEGLVMKADGTQWNPGAGAGVYCYYGGAWNKLG